MVSIRKSIHLKYFLDTITQQRIISIKNEIHQKESWLISVLEKGDVFDDTHAEMVRDFIRDNKNPARPKSLNELMIQFISSAFSYNRIRKQLRKINREVFNSSNYPIRGDHKNILAFILNDSRFEDDKY